MPRKIVRFPLGTREAMISLLLASCTPLGTMVVGIGANLGLNHQMNGFVAKTFSEPLRPTQQAAEAALARMRMDVSARQQRNNGGMIRAQASGRHIEIELQSLTPRTTWVQVVVRRNAGIVLDPATANEILAQTEKQLLPRPR